MAQAGDAVIQDQFSCPICLDLLTDPVTIPCGHNFCKGCINGCWDKNNQVSGYSCPQCRATFSSKPALNVNTLIADVVQNLKKTELPDTHGYAEVEFEAEDVWCDVCIGRKQKAIKSCLICLSSYCETDLKLHNRLSRGKQHKLIDATAQLQEKVCPHHEKVLEVYCRTDQQCICYLCTIDKHKGHETVSIATERNDKQMLLEMTKKKFARTIEGREQELQELRQSRDSFVTSAEGAVEDSEKIFTELLHFMEKRCTEVKELVTRQKKTVVKQAEDLTERLEQYVSELKRRIAELEQLSYTEDNIYFVQRFQTLCVLSGSGDLPSITADPHCSLRDVSSALSDLKKQVEDFCNATLVQISQLVIHQSLVLPPEPKTREEFCKYVCELTLDPNTANTNICLDGDSCATAGMPQSYPEHPSRFENLPQVLCREGLCGCCYWEVEWSGNDGVDIAVSYLGISRKGSGGNFRSSEMSWCLECSPSRCAFWYNSEETLLFVPCPSKIGVYLDHRAGILCFYDVSHTMTLLHRVETTFNESLYPGFSLHFSIYFQKYQLSSHKFKCALPKVGSRVQLIKVPGNQ